MIPFVWVDSFTPEAFGGNPAAICFLPDGRPAAWMQSVAAEMNLAETAFLRPLDGEDGRRGLRSRQRSRRDESAWPSGRRPLGKEFELRWFTPKVEVDLCGHATLASAHALWESGRLAPTETARFRTRSGLLTADRLVDTGSADAGSADTGSASQAGGGNGSSTGGGWIQMNFPVTQNEPVPPPEGMIEALGVAPLYVGRGPFDYLAQVDSEATLRGLAPDLRRLSAIEARGVIVTSRAAGSDYDFVSRFFAPRAGIDEDPVTGSAHCTLAPFWSRQLGKTRFLARQLSARGGVLRVDLQGDRVLLGGQAVTVLRGELLA